MRFENWLMYNMALRYFYVTLFCIRANLHLRGCARSPFDDITGRKRPSKRTIRSIACSNRYDTPNSQKDGMDT